MSSTTRDLAAARLSYEANNTAASREAHMVNVANPNSSLIRVAPESHKKGGDHMKTIIFGGLDGIITTFAVVAGAGGGGLSVSTVLIMGFSSLVADALSMGVGDALSSKAESEVIVRERARERWEYDNFPEGEIKEMVDIYEGRGMSKEDATAVIQTIAKYPELFIDAMMRDELGMDEPGTTLEHVKSGAICFTSFLINGSVPLLGFVAFLPLELDDQTLFFISIGLTAVTLFTLGAVKSRFTTRSWWVSGLEILVMGALTASVAYLIGWIVELIVNPQSEHRLL